MSIYRRDFDKTKFMYLFFEDENFLINIIKFGKKLVILLKKVK